MPFVTLLWSGVLFVLQRGTPGVMIFLLVWIASLMFALDDIVNVTYEQDWLPHGGSKRIKIDPNEAGIRFALGATVSLAMSFLALFVRFYEDPEANAGARVLLGVLPLSLATLFAYFFMFQS